MKKEHLELLKDLSKAYYNRNFDLALKNILDKDPNNKEDLESIISALCGVTCDSKEDFESSLKRAITHYNTQQNLISKISNCNSNCVSNTEGKSKCMLSCPFDAIKKDENNNTFIDSSMCLHCGECIKACPHGKFVEKPQLLPVIDLIKNNKKVMAIVAPAISGQFGENISIDSLRAAFIKFGFTDMVEVAFTADILSIKEAIEFDHHVQSKDDLMITSCCCPMWVGMLKSVYKNLVKDVSPSVSPMVAMGRILKKLDPDVKVVFIGPCLAKKAEAKEKDIKDAVDFVLTFEETKILFDIAEINLNTIEPVPSVDYTSRGGRLYARSGGVSIAVSDVLEELFKDKHSMFKPVKANGVRECKEILKKVESHEISCNFIEGMGCVGGCVGGPKALIPKELGLKYVDEFAYDSPIKVALNSSIMRETLESIGIDSLEDFKDSEKMKIFERDFSPFTKKI